ncbi:MAG: 50S ribosomal protein L24 [Gemmatimonadales bacterium]|jgi:large subunit ribosomal protein L24
MKPLVYKKGRKQRGTKPLRFKMHITKGDRVRVIRGEHKGAEGSVIRVLPKENRVVVEGVNVVTKHRQPTGTEEGGIVKFPAPIHASNVMLLDPKSDEPTRIRRQKDKDGTVERLSVKSGQPLPRSR